MLLVSFHSYIYVKRKMHIYDWVLFGWTNSLFLQNFLIKHNNFQLGIQHLVSNITGFHISCLFHARILCILIYAEVTMNDRMDHFFLQMLWYQGTYTAQWILFVEKVLLTFMIILIYLFSNTLIEYKCIPKTKLLVKRNILTYHQFHYLQ